MATAIVSLYPASCRIELRWLKHPSGDSATRVCSRAMAKAQLHAQAPASDAAPLDPPTIHSPQERIRALLPHHLEAFRRAFRAAFRVTEEIPSIAGLITEQRHRLWIQHYLSGAPTQPT
jgi:hypothetical protein